MTIGIIHQLTRATASVLLDKLREQFPYDAATFSLTSEGERFGITTSAPHRSERDRMQAYASGWCEGVRHAGGVL